MASLITGDAYVFLRTSFLKSLAQVGQVLGRYTHLEEADIRPRIRRFVHEHDHFPDPLPTEYDHGLMIVNEQVPATPIDAKLWAQLQNFIDDSMRHERAEQIMSMDTDTINDRMRRHRAYISDLHQRRNFMINVLEKQDKEGQNSAYSWRDVEEVDEMIKEADQVLQAYEDEGQHIVVSAREERMDLVAQHLELAQVLREYSRPKDSVDARAERGLSERRCFRWHTRHMYQPTNLRNHPFAELFVERDWAKQDDESQSKSDDSMRSSLKSAINAFELSHWNREVARDDFDHMCELVDAKRPKYLHQSLYDFTDP